MNDNSEKRSTKMDIKSTYIEMSKRSEKLKDINGFFWGPTSPTTTAEHFRCKTCSEVFTPKFDYQSKVNHLKTHKQTWTRYMDALVHPTNQQYNLGSMMHDDERSLHDLKLSK